MSHNMARKDLAEVIRWSHITMGWGRELWNVQTPWLRLNDVAQCGDEHRGNHLRRKQTECSCGDGRKFARTGAWVVAAYYDNQRSVQVFRDFFALPGNEDINSEKDLLIERLPTINMRKSEFHLGLASLSDMDRPSEVRLPAREAYGVQTHADLRQLVLTCNSNSNSPLYNRDFGSDSKGRSSAVVLRGNGINKDNAPLYARMAADWVRNAADMAQRSELLTMIDFMEAQMKFGFNQNNRLKVEVTETEPHARGVYIPTKHTILANTWETRIGSLGVVGKFHELTLLHELAHAAAYVAYGDPRKVYPWNAEKHAFLTSANLDGNDEREQMVTWEQCLVHDRKKKYANYVFDRLYDYGLQPGESWAEINEAHHNQEDVDGNGRLGLAQKAEERKNLFLTEAVALTLEGVARGSFTERDEKGSLLLRFFKEKFLADVRELLPSDFAERARARATPAPTCLQRVGLGRIEAFLHSFGSNITRSVVGQSINSRMESESLKKKMD